MAGKKKKTSRETRHLNTDCEVLWALIETLVSGTYPYFRDPPHDAVPADKGSPAKIKKQNRENVEKIARILLGEEIVERIDKRKAGYIQDDLKLAQEIQEHMDRTRCTKKAAIDLFIKKAKRKKGADEESVRERIQRAHTRYSKFIKKSGDFQRTEDPSDFMEEIYADLADARYSPHYEDQDDILWQLKMLEPWLREYKGDLISFLKKI